MGEVGPAAHVEVDAGPDGQGRGLAQVGGDALVDELADAVPVGHDHPVEGPLALEHLADEVLVGVHGGAVDVVEGRHDRADPGVDGRLEGPQVQVAQGVLADADRVVVAAAGGEAVAREVLGARSDPVGITRVVALEAPHERRRETAREDRRLAERLRDAAPAGLLRDVDHRGEGPRDTVDDGLAGRDGADLLGEVGVERRRDAERDRADRAVAVDDVAPEEERDAEAAALDGVALGGVDVRDEHALVALVAGRRAGSVEARADAAGRDLGGVVVGVDVGDLVGLADLLGQGHLRHEELDALLDGQGGIEPRPLWRAGDVSHVSGSPR